MDKSKITCQRFSAADRHCLCDFSHSILGCVKSCDNDGAPTFSGANWVLDVLAVLLVLRERLKA